MLIMLVNAILDSPKIAMPSGIPRFPVLPMSEAAIKIDLSFWSLKSRFARNKKSIIDIKTIRK